MSSNKRIYFRVLYPNDESPTLLIGAAACPVRDVSERGIRFVFTEDMRLRVNGAISCTLIFRDGQRYALRGSIVRIDTEGKMCSVQLSTPIPMGRIVSEQGFLLRRHAAA